MLCQKFRRWDSSLCSVSGGASKNHDILTWGYFGKALRDATSIYNFKITIKFVDVVGDNVNVRVSPPHRPCCVVAVCSGGGAAEGGAGVVPVRSGFY